MESACPSDPEVDAAYYGRDFAFLPIEAVPARFRPTRIASAEMLDASATRAIRVVGYGLDQDQVTYGKRQLVDVAIASKRCATQEDGSAFGCVAGRELVAAMPEFASDSCDGGGPAFVEDFANRGTYYLAAITSRAPAPRRVATAGSTP